MNKKMRCSQCKQRHIDFSDTIKLDKDGNPYNNACPVTIDILMINATIESKFRRFINKIIRECLNTLKRKEGN